MAQLAFLCAAKSVAAEVQVIAFEQIGALMTKPSKHGTEGWVTAMREDSGFFSFTRKMAAKLFIEAYMELTEEQRERLIGWWNEDAKKEVSK